MKKHQIAAQLYTLREFLKTEPLIFESLKKVKKMGYDAIQVSGMGPIDEKELVRICGDLGLDICATHENGQMIVEETERVIERLDRLNCRYTAYPWPHTIPSNRTEAVELAHKLNTAAEKMAAAGKVLCYHNHDIEFMRMEDGSLILDLLYDNAPALQGEIDTFWVQAGGQNPACWVKKLAGRMPLLHLKDYGIHDRRRAMFPIGSGNLDWQSIVPAGEAGGVEYFIVEQDECLKDPFDSLKESLDYITANFVK